MSWAAHQFEYYAVQGHLPKRWQGKVSFLAIVLGDQTCDFVGKLWSYGIDIGGTRYGPDDPEQWHRGWPGLGFSHSLFWAFAIAGLMYLCTRSRPWTLGIFLGAAVHALTDIGDSVGTMLAFPFSTQHFTVGAWAYGVSPAGRNLDAAAYFSSLGLVVDVAFLLLTLTNWRCLTLDYWRTNVVTADPKVWAWLGRRLPERALVTLYRSWFIYGVCRLIAWTFWAHVIERHQWDLSWGGPSWIPTLEFSPTSPWVTVLVALAGGALTYGAISAALLLPARFWQRTAGATPADQPSS